MRKLLLVVAIVVTAVPATAAVAWARTYLVLKHPSSDPGTLLYQPRNLELDPYYGFDALVQQTKWTGWGSGTAHGQGVIRSTMGMGPVIAHVTLEASSSVHVPSCTGGANDSRRYRELRARFHWLPDPGSNHVERQESKALSGNLSGIFEPQC